MPHINYRYTLLALAALLGSTARAQFVEVLTEAPVTIQASIQTTVTTVSSNSTSSTSATTSPVLRLTNLQVIQELIDSEIIDDSSPTGWSLVAVRNAPPDLFFVDAQFKLYAVKKTTPPTPEVPPVAIPADKFQAIAFGSVARYTERHQGRYIYSSSGAVTNHLVASYAPKFTTINSNVNHAYTIAESESAGFATVRFTAKDFADDYELFFYGITSVSVTTRGGFSGTVQKAGNDPEAADGLISLTITVGAPKLVPASKYPDVDPGISIE